jgi:hypothetical protein
VILNDSEEGPMKAWMLSPVEEKPITCPRSGVVPRVELPTAGVAMMGGGATMGGEAMTCGGATMGGGAMMGGVAMTGAGATTGTGATMGGMGNNYSFKGVGTVGSAITGAAGVGVATVASMVGAAFTGEGVSGGV